MSFADRVRMRVPENSRRVLKGLWTATYQYDGRFAVGKNRNCMRQKELR